jgi:hypothetical protein
VQWVTRHLVTEVHRWWCHHRCSYGAMEQAASSRGPVTGVRVSDDELFLVGTSEVPLSALHREILPRRVCPAGTGISSCFRRSPARTAGHARHLRVHQFDKVRCSRTPTRRRGTSDATRDPGVDRRRARASLRGEHADGDLGAAAAKRYDVEVWLPRRAPTGSSRRAPASTNFSARRLATRVKGASGLQPCTPTGPRGRAHAGVPLRALPGRRRRFTVPEVLRPFTGFDRSRLAEAGLLPFQGGVGTLAGAASVSRVGCGGIAGPMRQGDSEETASVRGDRDRAGHPSRQCSPRGDTEQDRSGRGPVVVNGDGTATVTKRYIAGQFTLWVSASRSLTATDKVLRGDGSGQDSRRGGRAIRRLHVRRHVARRSSSTRRSRAGATRARQAWIQFCLTTPTQASSWKRAGGRLIVRVLP